MSPLARRIGIGSRELQRFPHWFECTRTHAQPPPSPPKCLRSTRPLSWRAVNKTSLCFPQPPPFYWWAELSSFLREGVASRARHLAESTKMAAEHPANRDNESSLSLESASGFIAGTPDRPTGAITRGAPCEMRRTPPNKGDKSGSPRVTLRLHQIKARDEKRLAKVAATAEFLKEAKLPKTKPVETLKRAACDPFLKCKLAFCKTIADECQPFLQRFQTSKPMTPYLFEAVEKLLRYLMNRCVKPDLMKCTGPKLLSIDTKKSENLILSKNIDIGFATKRLLGETAITVTERQKLEFIHECRSMLTTMIAKLQEKSPLKQKAVRGLSSLDPCVIQHSPQLAQKRFSFLLEELNHANIINDVLAENAKKEYLHFCNLKKSELQEIFRPCDQFSDEVGLDTIYGSFLIGEANYKHLWEVIKICLVLSHGNATVEGGFSVNKSLLVENMHEKTVIAQRHIHDEIQEAGGIKNIHISKKMLDYVRGARKRYHEYLEMKKQEKSEKDKKKAEKRKLDIQVKDLEGERKKLMMATEEKREAIDVELQELKKKQASLY
uniref:Uncharacterized protein n=1 Tax=Timema cristinae TaxID=61476 RepID=A0A7R9H0K5_TIMCR|nr:unnamed protein product [Timema cristinae]